MKNILKIKKFLKESMASRMHPEASNLKAFLLSMSPEHLGKFHASCSHDYVFHL